MLNNYIVVILIILSFYKSSCGLLDCCCCCSKNTVNVEIDVGNKEGDVATVPVATEGKYTVTYSNIIRPGCTVTTFYMYDQVIWSSKCDHHALSSELTCLKANDDPKLLRLIFDKSCCKNENALYYMFIDESGHVLSSDIRRNFIDYMRRKEEDRMTREHGQRRLRRENITPRRFFIYLREMWNYFSGILTRRYNNQDPEDVQVPRRRRYRAEDQQVEFIEELETNLVIPQQETQSPGSYYDNIQDNRPHDIPKSNDESSTDPMLIRQPSETDDAIDTSDGSN